jgi:hypothetical protein
MYPSCERRCVSIFSSQLILRTGLNHPTSIPAKRRPCRYRQRPKSKGASKLHLQLSEAPRNGTNIPPKRAATTQPPTPSPTFSFMTPLPIIGDSHSSQNRHGTDRRPGRVSLHHKTRYRRGSRRGRSCQARKPYPPNSYTAHLACVGGEQSG